MKNIIDNPKRRLLAMNLSNMGFYDWYPLEDLITWDEKLHEINNLPLESTISRQEYFLSIVHPEDMERVQRNMFDVLNPDNETDKFEHNFRTIINGNTRYIKTSGIRKKNKEGLVDKVYGIVMDTSSQVEFENRIRENEARLSTVAEVVGFGTFEFLAKEDRTYWDKTMHAIFGLEESSDKNRTEHFLESVHPDDKTRVTNNFVRRMSPESDESTAFDEFKILVNEETKYITSYGRIVRDSKNNVIRVTGTMFDVSRQKQIEKELLDSQERLISQADELTRTNKNLEQFAYVSSHDIKAPVTNLNSLLNLLAPEDVVTKNGRDLVDKIKTTVNQMNTTILSLNHVFSVQRNLKLPRETLSLQQTLKQVLDSIDNKIIESSAEIASDFSKAPTINFPAVHMHSILQNLLVNSINYRKTGLTLKITVSSSPSKDGRTEIIVSDNGRGIDLDKYSNKVFGLFQRFHLDTAGKGMGLNIVKLILESYGGEISVSSMPDKGAKFTMKI